MAVFGTRRNFVGCWKRLLIVNFFKVLSGPDETCQSSNPVQTIERSLVPVTPDDSSAATAALVAQAVAAACRQRLLGHDRCPVGGRPADRVVREGVHRRHRCSECGDLFSSSTVLRRHQLVHSGLQPWSCGHCAARFSLKFNCSRHCRHKHPELPPFVVPTHPVDRLNQASE